MSELDLKRPAIIGGLIVGLGSVIPIVSLLNCCFCAWALIGGMMATKLLVDSSPRPVASGDGAKVGAFAGMIGGGIYFFGQMLLSMSSTASSMMLKVLEQIAANANNPEVRDLMQQAIEQAANQSAAQRVIGALPLSVVGGALLLGFTVLGGLLGVKFFEKRPHVPQDPYSPGGGGWPNS